MPRLGILNSMNLENYVGSCDVDSAGSARRNNETTTDQVGFTVMSVGENKSQPSLLKLAFPPKWNA
jgi:hypothetical protein